MKKSKRSKANDILSNLGGRFLLLLLLFSLCLVFLSSRITSYFTDQAPDINEALKEYLTSSFASNINNLYLYDIDRPMEEFMDSSAAISFFFSSEQYSPSVDLLSYLEDSLDAMAENNAFLTAAAVYAATSNMFVSGKNSESDIEDAELKALMERMIYDYNSSSLDKNIVSNEGFNTFLFQYQEYVIFSKELNTLSGSAHAIMFFLMDAEAFSSFIYTANDMIPYKVSIYDTHNSLLFSNSEESEDTAYSQLLSFTANGSAAADTSKYIYGSSDITGMQYLLEMELITLPGETTDPPLLYVLVVLSALLPAILLSVYLRSALRKPVERIRRTFRRLKLDTSGSVSDLPEALDQRVSSLLTENDTYKEIIQATSSEAVSHLFAKIIAGIPLDKEEARLTLSSTGYGFRLDDIYIAGVLHQTNKDFISAETRRRVLNMLCSIFEKFKEKKQCNLCAFLHDEKSFVVIGSFPAGTSIAKGKTRINELTEQIQEGIALLSLPLAVAFGHMYNSILDLSFSYNEAFKSMHYQTESSAERTESIASLKNAFPSLSGSETHSLNEADAETDADHPEPDPSEQVERRASQIAQLIWEEREDSLPGLITRTLATVFDAKVPLQEQYELSRHLISALTSHMLSYPFVNDNHLPHVLDEVPLHADLPKEERQEALRTALNTLCNDFSEAVKKLRNPYVLASQEYIREHYDNPYLSLEEIAENLKIAPNYLSTIFSKSLGVKLFEYINEYRLEKSIHLLLDTDKTVNEISMECGFGSSRNYIRIFKKYKENTPGAYRKQHRPQG